MNGRYFCAAREFVARKNAPYVLALIDLDERDLPVTFLEPFR